jgi:hypothetical protein
LGPAARLEIYARMYCARLIDVLAEDYPRVAAILGPDAFGAVAHAYVTAHRSIHPSLRWFGRGFSDFLAADTAAAHPEFVPDLARLEWARLGVFDAADALLLDVETLRRLPPAEWPRMRLRLVPALEILVVAWPVHRIWAADDAGVPIGDWVREDARLRVWRQDDRVFQASMDAVERVALESVQTAGDFAAMCDALATVVPPGEVASTAAQLVLRWIADGLLRGDVPPR